MIAKLKEKIPARFRKGDSARALSNAAWQMSDRVVRMVVGLVVNAWVAVHLNPSGFGELSTAVALCGTVGMLATLGFENVVVRELVKEPDRTPEILGTAWCLRMLAGFGTWSLVVAMCMVLYPGDRTLLLVTAITAGSFLVTPLYLIDSFFQAKAESKRVVLAKLAGFAVTMTSRAVLVYLNAPVYAFAWVFVQEMLVQGLCMLWAYQQRGDSVWLWRFSRSRAGLLLSTSWRFMIAVGLAGLWNNLDRVMLSILGSKEQVGIYAVAATISSAWFFVPLAVIASTLPFIVQARQESEAAALRRFGQLLRGLVLLALGAIAGAYLLGGTVITLLYKTDYLPSIPILWIHAFSGITISLSMARDSWLVSENLGRVAVYCSAFGALASFTFCTFLIPTYGAYGAAFSLIGAQCVTVFVVPMFFKECRPLMRKVFGALILRA